jgi:hypothetical protein
MTDYTKQAQMLAKQYARNFHGPSYSLDDNDADFSSLREASDLIAEARVEKQQILRNIEAQRGTQQALDQQREDVSLLPDREAQRIQAEWREQATAQGKAYSESKNRGATPRAFDPNNKEQADIRSGVISWIKKQKLRGNFGGRKTLGKN